MEELEEEIISEETIIGDEELDFEYTDLIIGNGRMILILMNL
jgi:hypothetical protein